MVPLAHLGNFKQRKGECLKSFLNRFTTELSKVRWAPDAGVLAHLTNGVFLELNYRTSSSQNSAKMWASFTKRQANSWNWRIIRRLLHKAQEASTSKKNDQWEKVKKKKGSEKRKAYEKQGNSPKKSRSGVAYHKALFLKYTSYHALNAPQDHIYVISTKKIPSRGSYIEKNYTE